MVDPAAPHAAVLFRCVQVGHEYAGRPPAVFRHDDHLAGLARGNGPAVPAAQLDIILRRRRAHGAGHGLAVGKVCREQGRLRLAVALAERYARALGEAAEHLRRERLASRRGMPERRHVGYALAHEIAVDRGRSAERRHAAAVDDARELLGVEIVEVIHHDGAADEPLAVYLAPGGLGPAGLRHGKMQAVLLGLLPVFRRDYVRERICVAVDDALGIARGARREIEHHRLIGAGLDALKHAAGALRRGGEVLKALGSALHAPELHPASGAPGRLSHPLRHSAERSAYDGVDLGRLKTVDEVVDCEHMCRGYHHGPELVQRHGRKPVFIVPPEYEHHAVAAAYAARFEHVRHAAAHLAHVGERELEHIAFRAAPHHCPLIRLELGREVDDVIAEIEVFRIIESEFYEPAVFVGQLMAVFLIYAHDFSLIAAAAMRLKRSYRCPSRSGSFDNSLISSDSSSRMRP